MLQLLANHINGFYHWLKVWKAGRGLLLTEQRIRIRVVTDFHLKQISDLTFPPWETLEAN